MALSSWRTSKHTLSGSNMGTGGMMDGKVNELLVNWRQVAFSSFFCHAGGSNYTIDKTGYVCCLFACMVLAEPDYPSEVGTRVRH
jgi:hypothetical protein